MENEMQKSITLLKDNYKNLNDSVAELLYWLCINEDTRGKEEVARLAYENKKHIEGKQKSSWTNMEKCYAYLRTTKAEVKNIRDEIQNLYTKFNNPHKRAGFKTFLNFLDWYFKQEQKCCYCQTEQSVLTDLFTVPIEENGKTKAIFASKKPGWKNGSLQIERKVAPEKKDAQDQLYNDQNCVLACVLCNNAKSDLISHEDFKSFFGKKMGEYLKNRHMYFTEKTANKNNPE